MRSQRFTGFLDRFDQGVSEFLVSEMLSRAFDQVLPQLLTTFFVDRFVTDDRELVRARRNKNEHGVALRHFMHSETVKFFRSRDERIGIQFAALNVNADLSGSLRFGVADRLHDPIVLKFAEKFFRSH